MSIEVNDGGTNIETDDSVLGVSHLSLHVRDIDEAIRFWTTIFNAKPYVFAEQLESGRSHLPHDEQPSCVLLGGQVLHFSLKEGISGWDNEYPHFAFRVNSKQLVTLKKKLDEAGVMTHPIWTRNKVEALMYFRDPSGNLFEFFCWQFENTDGLEIDANKGGAFRPPVGELKYDWKG